MIYPVSPGTMDAIYKRYLSHRLNFLCHCHSGKEKYKKHSHNNTMCIFNTGALIGLTPYRADFIDYLPLKEATIKDISKITKVLGIVIVMWKLKSRQGDDIFIPCVAYHMSGCDIRLKSPQSYFQLHGGHAEVTEHMITTYLPGVDKLSTFQLTNCATYPQLCSHNALTTNSFNLDLSYFHPSLPILSNWKTLVQLVGHLLDRRMILYYQIGITRLLLMN
jgi:hypothetical protein